MYNKIINVIVVVAILVFCLYFLTKNYLFAAISLILFLGVGFIKFISDRKLKKQREAEKNSMPKLPNK